MRMRSRVIALALLSFVATTSGRATWIAEPGTVKVLVRKKPAFRGAGGFPSDILDLELKNLGARLVDNQDSFLLLQVPSASASPTILSAFADLAVVRDDFDLIQFDEGPIDARMSLSLYPLDWQKSTAAPFPQRDAYVIQFATVPQPSWLKDMVARGVTVLDYLPSNGYLVLMDAKTAEDIAAKLPVQFLALHQPFHRASKAVRDTKTDFIDVVISIAAVPEAADALGLLAGKATKELRAPEDGGDRHYYRVSIDQKIVQPLAAFPAVISIDLYTPPRPSGEREAHLTLGDTLVNSPAAVLKPVLGDQRQWLVSKGVANYKTAVKVAILDTGLDIGSSTDVHPDLKNASGTSSVTVKNYTKTSGSDADCYGHGTFIAGLLSGNAGAANSTQVKDTGAAYGDANFFMGLGITPELPLVVGRIWNFLGSSSAPIFDPQEPRDIYRDLATMGVSIVSNSYNFGDSTKYTTDSQLQDKLVRSTDDGGPQMAIYFSSGNAEAGNVGQHFISPPATAKNVISVGGSENFNPNPYPELTVVTPSDTGGSFADNGNQIWALSQHGKTVSDHRIKPDIVAPSSAIESVATRDTSTGCRFPAIGVLIDPASPVGQRHWWSRGTSFSAPLAAGAGALLYTWFKNTTGVAPKPSLLKAMQITLASDLTGTGHPPDDFQGWGKVDLTRAFLTSDHYVWNNEEANSLLTGVGQIAYLPSAGTAYRIKDTSKPVRITLVWTDGPGSTMATMLTALTNNLDLTVRMKGAGIGRYALGNDFNSSTGHSNVRTSGGVPNTVDNVEQVVFTSAEAGTDHFQVEVLAQALTKDALHVWTEVQNQQDFSLFIENAEPYQNNAAVTAQVAPTTVQAGASFVGSFTLMNTGNSSWTEGPNNFYRLGSVAAGNPFGGRLFLAPGEVINPGSSKTFTLNATAPYAAGTYPFGWQMVEEYVAVFGAATSSVVSVAVTPTSSAFYTLTPCRVVDTRNPAGLYGGPALAPGQQRAFPLRNQCGIPATAKAMSANLTAVTPSGNGYVLAYPANIAQPVISTLNYKTGLSRANNAILTLDTGGNVICAASVAATDFVLDVNGYFQ